MSDMTDLFPREYPSVEVGIGSPSHVHWDRKRCVVVSEYRTAWSQDKDQQRNDEATGVATPEMKEISTTWINR